MPRFAANLSMLFTEHAPIARPAAAAKAGFRAIEIQFPYEMAAGDFAHACRKAAVECVLINFPGGDFARGDRGLGALPGRRDEFRAGVETARRYLAATGTKRVNLLAGVPGPEVEPARARATLVENIRFAARAVADLGVTVCVEAINTRDVPGFFACGSDQVVGLVDEAGEKNAALQYDLYHMQIMEGDLIPTFRRLRPRIGHVQFADTPGRHEPGTGEINFANVFAALDAAGWDGWVAAEYRPSGKTEESLAWLR
jgi:hydroxypyruvate isomerase